MTHRHGAALATDTTVNQGQDDMTIGKGRRRLSRNPKQSQRRESDPWRRREKMRAAHECSHCAHCERPLKAGEPVWRRLLSLGPGFFGGWSRTVAPICERCGSSCHIEFRGPQPCENCGRSVHQEYNRRFYRHTFCCEVCVRAFFATAARLRRAEERDPRPCAQCGETFEPTRKDARFCSGACKQLAYRKRQAVTGRKSERVDAFTNRNETRGEAVS